MIDAARRFPRWMIIALVALVVLAVARGCVVYGRATERERATELRALRGIDVDKILMPEHAAGLPSPLGGEFAVTDAGNILLRGGDDLIEVERDGPVLTYEKLNTSGPAPSSFALDESSILTVSELYLGQLEGGGATNAVPLPAAGMRLAPSQLSGTVYLFGGTEATERRVYLVQEDGSLTILAELPSPVVAVADNRSSVYVAGEGDPPAPRRRRSTRDPSPRRRRTNRLACRAPGRRDARLLDG